MIKICPGAVSIFAILVGAALVSTSIVARAGEVSIYFDATALDPVLPDDPGCQMTEMARILAEEVAKLWSSSNQGTMSVVGHDDRLKPDDVSLAVSECRANTVTQSLMEYGVPEDKITVEARGEMEPAYPTDDGVADPLNRRVEVRW